ncbi:cytoplasmic dynein 1 light intermediate chain 1-like [Erinaceus europaeus]|uniref:Dynein light intermediate chain n=1 Tax=Erinaceus europaeus TaxID=9365 RepID=A0ABM3WV14_ERIEU|nr:cytoplasmic dynein 1 light intermediate chain 1-like [Erinaceus europaeus]
MAAVGRVGSFGSSPPGLASAYAGGPLANELASGNGGAAAGDDEDGQNLWSCILSEVSTRSRSKLPAGKNVLLLGKCRVSPPQVILKCLSDAKYRHLALFHNELLISSNTVHLGYGKSVL